MEIVELVELQECSLEALETVLGNDGCADGYLLSELVGDDLLRESAFWRKQVMQMDYAYYMEYIASDDEAEEDDDDRDSTGKLSAAAIDAIRAGLAKKFGITAKHVAPPRQEGLKPIGEYVEKVLDNALISPPAPEVDALPVRAIAHGQPQIMGGLGAWDNAGYFANDEDEGK